MALWLRPLARAGWLAALPVCAALATCVDSGNAPAPRRLGASGTGSAGGNEPGRSPALAPAMRCPP